MLQKSRDDLDELRDVAALIDRAVVDDLPIFIKEGGLIKSGYDATLDELLEIYSSATCPHGRPAFITLRLEELERRFLRHR